MTDCISLDEVRKNIDRIDREIVELISERSTYVRQAAGLKKTTDDVTAPKRMISCFIKYEMKEVGK